MKYFRRLVKICIAFNVLIDYVFGMKKETVYFIEGNGLVKIGATRKYAKTRLRQLQVMCPFPLKLLHIVATNDCFSLESYFHDFFKEKRFVSEWFKLSKDDLALVRSDLFIKNIDLSYFNEKKRYKSIDLKVERIRRRVTMKELSREMGRSLGWLSHLENDKTRITPQLVALYMDSLSNLKNGDNPS